MTGVDGETCGVQPPLDLSSMPDDVLELLDMIQKDSANIGLLDENHKELTEQAIEKFGKLVYRNATDDNVKTYMPLALTNSREEFIEAFTITALRGYMSRVIHEWEIPKELRIWTSRGQKKATDKMFKSGGGENFVSVVRQIQNTCTAVDKVHRFDVLFQRHLSHAADVDNKSAEDQQKHPKGMDDLPDGSDEVGPEQLKEMAPNLLAAADTLKAGVHPGNDVLVRAMDDIRAVLSLKPRPIDPQPAGPAAAPTFVRREFEIPGFDFEPAAECQDKAKSLTFVSDCLSNFTYPPEAALLDGRKAIDQLLSLSPSSLLTTTTSDAAWKETGDRRDDLVLARAQLAKHMGSLGHVASAHLRALKNKPTKVTDKAVENVELKRFLHNLAPEDTDQLECPLVVAKKLLRAFLGMIMTFDPDLHIRDDKAEQEVINLHETHLSDLSSSPILTTVDKNDVHRLPIQLLTMPLTVEDKDKGSMAVALKSAGHANAVLAMCRDIRFAQWVTLPAKERYPILESSTTYFKHIVADIESDPELVVLAHTFFKEYKPPTMMDIPEGTLRGRMQRYLMVGDSTEATWAASSQTPPMELLARFSSYKKVNFEKLVGITETIHGTPHDIENMAMILDKQISAEGKTDEQIAEEFITYLSSFSSLLVTTPHNVGVGKWCVLSPNSANRDKVRYYKENKSIVQRMQQAGIKGQKDAKELIKSRVLSANAGRFKEMEPSEDIVSKLQEQYGDEADEGTSRMMDSKNVKIFSAVGGDLRLFQIVTDMGSIQDRINIIEQTSVDRELTQAEKLELEAGMARYKKLELSLSPNVVADVIRAKISHFTDPVERLTFAEQKVEAMKLGGGEPPVDIRAMLDELSAQKTLEKDDNALARRLKCCIEYIDQGRRFFATDKKDDACDMFMQALNTLIAGAVPRDLISTTMWVRDKKGGIRQEKVLLKSTEEHPTVTSGKSLSE